MTASESKIYSLPTAVETFVKSGDHISLGGFTINRNPMAAVHEIIRQEGELKVLREKAAPEKLILD